MSAVESGVGVQLKCSLCLAPGRKRIILRDGIMVHHILPMPRPHAYEGLAVVKSEGRPVFTDPDSPRLIPCADYDSECRHRARDAVLGWHWLAWWPTRCRNGKVRWFKWLEEMPDGSFTLGDRAH